MLLERLNLSNSLNPTNPMNRKIRKSRPGIFILLFFFLLFLFPGSLFAVDPLDLRLAVPVVAILSIIFISLSTMLAHTLSDSRLEAWVKNELREVLAGVLLVAIITGALAGSNSIVSTLAGGTGEPISQARIILDGLENNYHAVFANLIRISTRLRMAVSFYPSMNIPILFVAINYATNPLSGIGAMLQPISIAAQGSSTMIFLLEAIRALLVFVQAVGPTVILPLSFIFRLLPFTRKLGNTLIAVSFGAMLFFPVSILLMGQFNSALGRDFPAPHINLDAITSTPGVLTVGQGFCNALPLRLMLQLTEPLFGSVACSPLLLTPFTAPAFPLCSAIMSYIVYPLLVAAFEITFAVFLLVWLADINSAVSYANSVFDAVYPFLKDVGNLVFVGYLDIILIFIIVFTGIRSLSVVLGGESYMAGIQRLI